MDTTSNDNLFDIRGKVACVTGASSGLGRHTADVLLRAGCKVVGIARREDMLSQWASEHKDTAGFVTADLADRTQIKDVARQVDSLFGPPDILINAAGINTREAGDEVTDQNWDLTLSLNLTAPFFLAKAFVSAMKEKGFGRIVNFASLQSYRAFPGGVAYGASKGGIVQLTRSMAQDWSRYGITANALVPGFFQTALTAQVFSDRQRAEANARQTCIGRNGELSDLDGPVLFLCSPASAYVTGQILPVDGGYTAK